MSTVLKTAKRIIFVSYIVAIHLALAYLGGEKLIDRYASVTPIEQTAVSDPVPASTIPAPPPVPESFADPAAADNLEYQQSTPAAQTGSAFVIPVVGVKPDELLDTFSDSRSEGRSHDAIDIAAPAGTPVIAATDGEIVKFHDSQRGGITIYQLTADRRFVLYYGHLQRRADELQVGMKVRQGATIGFVGDTGNAGAGNNHLHFSVSLVTDPNRPWEGININPYPLLRHGLYPQIP